MSDKMRGLFEKLVKQRLDRARRRKGFEFKGLRRLIEKRGAFETAKMLVSEGNTGNLNGGLKILVRYGLSDLSVEQAVIDCENFKLFTKNEVASAKRRLKIAKAFFEKD